MLERLCRSFKVLLTLTQAVLLAAAVVVAVVPAGSVHAASLITKPFSYTGSTESFTVPPGVTSITVTLKGGQGGLGGPDGSLPPTPGGYQGVVRGIMSVTPGQVITVAVGGGGGTGANGGSAPGGTAGMNPLAGYDGAVGGTAGSVGSSGGGGGSGAASVVKIDGTPVVVVAAGAGGNGGNGLHSATVGRRSEETHLPRSDVQPSTDGRRGMHTSEACTTGGCDGGASGAGGGGAVGGQWGSVQYGGSTATEYFGFGGYPGANSIAGLTNLVATYEYYEGNSAHGSITFSYDDGKPGAPLELAGTARTGAVALTWIQPLPSGVSPISDYRVEYALSASGTFTLFTDGVSTTTSAVVDGLTNGVPYFFRVTALNAEGAGTSATTAVSVVPSDVPARPTISAVTPVGGGLVVDFTPGSSHSAITSYEYRLNGGAWSAGSVNANRLTISGLTNGIAYSVEMRAVSNIGPSDASTPPELATPVDVAQAPSEPRATPGDGSIQLEWAAPSVNNGSAVTDYVVQHATSLTGTYTTVADGTSDLTSTLITGLANGTTYWVRVAAVNGAGTGAYSPSALATPFTAPAAPSIVAAPGDGSLVVTVTPGFNGGATVTRYEYRLGQTGSWMSTGSADAQVTLSGLANAQAYDVEVRAVNAAGASGASAVITATPRTVPSAPSISAVALNTGAVSVSFTVGSDGGAPLTNVEYSLDGGINWLVREPAGVSSPLAINNLIGGVTYPIQVRVLNAAGESAASNTSVVTAKRTPSAPAISVAPADRSLIVTIGAPMNGGTPITGYEYRLDAGEWTPWGSAKSPLTIPGLTNGTPYDVQVRARNDVGAGVESPVVVATPRTVPGAPSITATTIDSVSAEIEVVFTPGSHGGATITTYQYSTDAGATWRTRQSGTTTSPLTITTESDGVTPLDGQAYPVQIRAMNAAGAGLASSVTPSSIPTPPSAPVITGADPRDSSVLVRFTPPANGGAAITGYEYFLGTGDWNDTGSLDSQFVVTGLTNSATYDIRVRAVNTVDPGPASAPYAVRVFTTPASPTLGTVRADDGGLEVPFTDGDDGGSAITGHEYSTDGGFTWRAADGNASPLLITSESNVGALPLTNGRVYAVQLRSINAAGPGGASETRMIAPQGKPGTPNQVAVAPADNSLMVSYIAPGDGGSAITAYQYRLGAGAWNDTGSLSSPFTIPGLENGTPYSVTVRALNAVGEGAASSTVSATPRTTPHAPETVSTTSASHEVTVTWTAPASDGGSPITGYTARLHTQAVGGALIGTCTTTVALACTVTGLTNGVTVHADVVALNAAGTSDPSAPRSTQTPLSAPQVTIASIAPGANHLTVTATLVDGGGAPIIGYDYQLGTAVWQSSGSAVSPLTIGGLTTGQEYAVRIRARSAGGIGEWSPVVLAVPYTAPGSPIELSATSAAGSAVLSWNEPATDGGNDITDYTIQFSTNSTGAFTTFADGVSSTTAATVAGLTNGTTYYFRVIAVNAAGSGLSSTLASAVPLGTPSAPTIGAITPGSTYLSVSFTVPSSTGGTPITRYEYSFDGVTWHTATGSTSPIVITGLTNGQTYAVRLRAANAVGSGDASAPVSGKPFGLPSAILGFRATPGASNVTLEWDAANDNGSQIIWYNIIRWTAASEGGNAATYTTTDTSFTVPIPGNGTYYFTIEAMNAAGTGPRTAPRTSAIVGGTVPSAPTALTLSVVDANATTSWTAGAATTPSVSSYLVQRSIDGAAWSTLSSGSSATSTAFTLTSTSAPYGVRVAAVSAAGVGSFATLQAPLTSTSAVAQVSIGGAALAAGVNANGVTATAGFEFATSVGALGTDPTKTILATPSSVTGNTTVTTSATIAGLQPNTTYYVRSVVTAPNVIVRGAVGSFTTHVSIISSNLNPVYTGAPVQMQTVTVPADVPVVRTFTGTNYPTSSTPPTRVGTYQVTTTPADGVAGGSEVVQITILPKPVTLTVSAAVRAYDGTTAASLSIQTTGLISGDDVVIDTTKVFGTFVSPGAGTNKVVQVVAAPSAVAGSDASNYLIEFPDEISGTITRAPQTLHFTTQRPAQPTVSATYTPDVVSSEGLTPQVRVVGDGAVCTINGGVVTLVGAGDCIISASEPGGSNVEPAADVQQVLTVRHAQALFFAEIADIRIDADPIVLPDATPEGRPLTYSATPAQVCTVIGVTVALQGEGACVVTVHQAGTDTHHPAQATRSFSVSRIPQVISVLELSVVTADHGPVSLPSTTSGGLTISYTSGPASVCTVTGQLLSLVGPGTCTVVATQAGDVMHAPATLTTTLLVEASFVPAPDVAAPMPPDPPRLDGYSPVTASRILDTREVAGRLTGGTELRVAVPASLVPSDATGLVVNLAATNASAPGFITAYPCTSPRPLASAVNFTTRVATGNLVEVPWQAGGELCLWSNADTDVVIDLQGVHRANGGSRFVPRAAIRLVDTRESVRLVPGQTVTVDVIGDSRAAPGTTTVALNVAVDDPALSGFLTVHPCDAPRPLASNLNFVAGQTQSNEVLVSPGADGTVCVYTTAATELVVDLHGSYGNSGRAGFTPLVATRLADTRSSTPVAAGGVLELRVPGADDDTLGATLSIAATGSTGPGFLTVHPCGSMMPLASNLNYAAGQTISNHVTASLSGDGRVCIYASSETHVVIDLEGVYRVRLTS